MVSLNEALEIINNKKDLELDIRYVQDNVHYREYDLEVRTISKYIRFPKQIEKGFILLATGPMFSGKTTFLLNLIDLLKTHDFIIQTFKPEIDNRYSDNKIVSHDKITFDCENIKTSNRFLERINQDTQIVVIDEVQFIDRGIISHLESLRDSGKIIFLTGLNLDFKREAFNIMPELLCIADYIEKFSASCKVCGKNATLTQRMVNREPAHYQDEVILIGESDYYEARCRDHHRVKGLDDLEKD